MEKPTIELIKEFDLPWKEYLDLPIAELKRVIVLEESKKNTIGELTSLLLEGEDCIPELISV